MKALIADRMPERTRTELEEMGVSVVQEEGLSGHGLETVLRNERPQILVVRSTRVTERMLDAAETLGLVIRAGAGYNTIDVEAASRRSVYIANCPGKNAAAVAELTLGLILSIDRRIPDNVSDLRAGRWNKKEYSRADGVLGKTLGVIGTGTIGKEVVKRARAFGMTVVAWSRSLTPEGAGDLDVVHMSDPVQVAAAVDIVTVHLALNTETRGLIGSSFFDAMRPGAVFINTSRAEVIDEPALLEAVQNKGIRAGLDVFTGEPQGSEGVFEGPVRGLDGVYGTHHIGASTAQAQSAIADEVVEIIRTYVATGRVKNCVNLLDRTPAKFVLAVRHRNRIGVLSEVLRIIREAEINVESMENIIFAGGEGACANIQIDDELAPEAIDGIQAIGDDVHSVIMTPIGS